MGNRSKKYIIKFQTNQYIPTSLFNGLTQNASKIHKLLKSSLCPLVGRKKKKVYKNSPGFINSTSQLCAIL